MKVEVTTIPGGVVVTFGPVHVVPMFPKVDDWAHNAVVVMVEGSEVIISGADWAGTVAWTWPSLIS